MQSPVIRPDLDCARQAQRYIESRGVTARSDSGRFPTLDRMLGTLCQLHYTTLLTEYSLGNGLKPIFFSSHLTDYEMHAWTFM